MPSPGEIFQAVKIAEYLYLLSTSQIGSEAGAKVDFSNLGQLLFPDCAVFAAGKKGIVTAPTAADVAAFNLLSAGGWKTLAALLGLTTPGDLLFFGSDNKLHRLPKGAEGQVLTMAAGLPSWAPPAAGTGPGGGGGSTALAPIDAAYTRTAGGGPLYLPAAPTAGNFLLIVMCGSSGVGYHAPPGFTIITSGGPQPYSGGYVATKIADGSEGTTLNGFGGGDYLNLAYFEFPAGCTLAASAVGSANVTGNALGIQGMPATLNPGNLRIVAVQTNNKLIVTGVTPASATLLNNYSANQTDTATHCAAIASFSIDAPNYTILFQTDTPPEAGVYSLAEVKRP